MIVPEVEEKLKSLCNGNVKHVVLFGIEVRFYCSMFLSVEFNVI